MSEASGRLFDFFRTRKRDYQHVFTTMSGQTVFKDLAMFCRLNDSCVVLNKDGTVNNELSWMLQGRREVILRIQHHTGLTPDQLMTLYSGGSIKAGE
jgi:hypothetical protein